MQQCYNCKYSQRIPLYYWNDSTFAGFKFECHHHDILTSRKSGELTDEMFVKQSPEWCPLNGENETKFTGG